MNTVYHALDAGFIFFHSALILFNLFGWLWRRTRLANLLTLTLTLASWLGLGICYGWGYCPCTDWHWTIRQRLGHEDMPRSYLQFLLLESSGYRMPGALLDGIAVAALALALGASITLNVRDWRASRRRTQACEG